MPRRLVGRILLTAAFVFVAWGGFAALLAYRLTSTTGRSPSKGAEQVPSGPAVPEWTPAPDVALLLTGRQSGYLEPCGCTSGQKGGVGRRHNLIKRIQGSRSWPLVALDLGGLIGKFGQQQEIKFQHALNALSTMGYQAVGLGMEDVNLPVDVLLGQIAGETAAVPFVSANLSLYDPEMHIPKSHIVAEAGGLKVGVTAVFGREYRERIQDPAVIWRPPSEALPPVLEQLQAAETDLQVLLAYAPLDETRKLMEQFPEFDVVVTAGGAEEPADPEIVGDRVLVETGKKGKDAVVVGYFGESSQQRFRAKLVPLDTRFSETLEMQQEIAAYLDTLERENLVETMHRQPYPGGAEFVGSAKCGSCHKVAFAIWQESNHSKATQALFQENRRHDPECVTCHVTGWEPQQAIPYESGFLSFAESGHLFGNGCENCHGPGSLHVAAEEDPSATAEAREEARKQLRLDVDFARMHVCIKCHDTDNSPQFKFEEYWPKIVHRGTN